MDQPNGLVGQTSNVIQEVPIMYDLLKDISSRPEPFSRYTVKDLWTRPHLSRQMLATHLDQESGMASRPFAAIDSIVGWLDSQLDLSGRTLCDLGCGPGLYAQRFSALGADVTGVDFSAHSLEYARATATENEQAIRYIHADYLLDELPTDFDVITLIFTDLGALAPEQRVALLGRMRSMLNPGGRIVVDVLGMGALAGKTDETQIEANMMGGFWSEDDYVCIQRSFVYPEERLTLDRFLIVEPSQSWQIFSWAQSFTPESLTAELNTAGFEVEQMVGDLAGAPLQPESDLIGVIARAF